MQYDKFAIANNPGNFSLLLYNKREIYFICFTNTLCLFFI